MLTAREVLAAGEWTGPACDHIALDYDERHRRRFAYVADHGTAFLLDLPRAAILQHGDALRLSDGRLIELGAASEVLMEVRAGPGIGLVRIAWHVGNRHLPAELHEDCIRLREDHVIRAMLTGLGARVMTIEAPFVPEQGAYAAGREHEHKGRNHGHHHHHAD